MDPFEDGIRIEDAFGNKLRAFRYRREVVVEVTSRQTWMTPDEGAELAAFLRDCSDAARNWRCSSDHEGKQGNGGDGLPPDERG
jgi:hypothetical protein